MNISDLINDEKILSKSTRRRPAKKRSIGSNQNLNDSRMSRGRSIDSNRSGHNKSVDSKHSSPNLRQYRKDTELVEANSSEEDSEKVEGDFEQKKVRKAVFKNKSKGKRAKKNNAREMNYLTENG